MSILTIKTSFFSIFTLCQKVSRKRVETAEIAQMLRTKFQNFEKSCPINGFFQQSGCAPEICYSGIFNYYFVGISYFYFDIVENLQRGCAAKLCGEAFLTQQRRSRRSTSTGSTNLCACFPVSTATTVRCERRASSFCPDVDGEGPTVLRPPRPPRRLGTISPLLRMAFHCRGGLGEKC